MCCSVRMEDICISPILVKDTAEYNKKWCSVEQYSVLYCSILHSVCVIHCVSSTVKYCVVQHNVRCIMWFIVSYCIVLYCIVLYCIVLYCIVLYCFLLYCIVLYCIVLYCIVLYCIVLYCIVLYCVTVCRAVKCNEVHFG